MTLPVPEDGQPIADKTPWKLAKTAADRARLCIRAAEMRSRGQTYVKIAETLGMENAQAAKKCAEVGYGLAPGDDLRTGRRRAAEELDMMRRELWDVIEAEYYKVGANGQVALDPKTGEPLFDPDAKIAAVRALAEVNKQYRTLLGTDAPRLSASLSATGSLEDIRAEIERRRAELDQAEREHGAPDDDGPPALPPAL
jgi:hypothetical protein